MRNPCDIIICWLAVRGISLFQPYVSVNTNYVAMWEHSGVASKWGAGTRVSSLGLHSRCLLSGWEEVSRHCCVSLSLSLSSHFSFLFFFSEYSCIHISKTLAPLFCGLIINALWWGCLIRGCTWHLAQAVLFPGWMWVWASLRFDFTFLSLLEIVFFLFWISSAVLTWDVFVIP